QHLRLVDHFNRCEGRVEVYKNGQWDKVCATKWGINNGKVVCNELNCGTYVSSYDYPTKSGPILLSGVECSGTESFLLDCKSDPQVSTSCTHDKDFRVTCSGDTVRLSRWVCRGRLEVKHGGTYKTVCPQSVDSRDTDVVCRELGCGVSGAVLGGAVFGQGTGPIWADEIQYGGDEGSPTVKINQNNCTHTDDVSIICFGYTDFRLVNGPDRCSGRVEMKYGGQWGTVCDHGWDLRDATVLCQQLQCGHAEAVLGPDRFGQGNKSVFNDIFDCEGTETTLRQCPISPWTHSTCINRSDLGVVCSKFKQLRLVSEQFECAGRVEVFYNGTWGSVCSNRMRAHTATLICQQLSCGDSVSLDNANHVPGLKWLDNIECTRHHTSLWQCPSSPWGDDSNCDDRDVAEIICRGSVFLILYCCASYVTKHVFTS
ncbi:DMBT1 protein, partial [Amia calva]|nr:DMBT1 protein [Amia calva]